LLQAVKAGHGRHDHHRLHDFCRENRFLHPLKVMMTLPALRHEPGELPAAAAAGVLSGALASTRKSGGPAG
jgi:hypothetical protein